MANPSPLPPGLTLTIPGQGDYLQGMSGAQSAYEKAVARLTAQRRQQQYLAGLNSDWSVDPSQMYGGYQQMLQKEGGDINAAQDAAQQRGLYGGGLANQNESALRYGQAAEQLGFRNQLSDWENQYQQGMASAKQDQAAANLAAQQQAAQNAYNNNQYTPYYDPGQGQDQYPPQDQGYYPPDQGGPTAPDFFAPLANIKPNAWNPAPKPNGPRNNWGMGKLPTKPLAAGPNTVSRMGPYGSYNVPKPVRVRPPGGGQGGRPGGRY